MQRLVWRAVVQAQRPSVGAASQVQYADALLASDAGTDRSVLAEGARVAARRPRWGARRESAPASWRAVRRVGADNADPGVPGLALGADFYRAQVAGLRRLTRAAHVGSNARIGRWHRRVPVDLEWKTRSPFTAAE